MRILQGYKLHIILFVFIFLNINFVIAEESDDKKSYIRHTFKNGIDPTLFITRVEILNAYDNRVGTEGERNTSRLRFDYAASEVFRVTTTLPHVYNDTEEESNSGFGDASLGMFYKPFDYNHTAIATGFNIDLDTGENSVGEGTNVFEPVLAGAHELEAISELLLLGWIEPRFSFGSGENEHDINQLRLRMMLHRPFLERYWWLIEPEAIIDFENSGDTEWFFSTELGMMITPEFGLWMSPGIDLHGASRESDWRLRVGIRCLFF